MRKRISYETILAAKAGDSEAMDAILKHYASYIAAYSKRALFDEYGNRYEVTDDGISPRTIPGMKNGIHHVTGVEHDETGKPSEVAANRVAQMDKRMRKIESVHFKNPLHINAPHEEADLLFVGFNSTRGVIEEVMGRLEADGVKVNHAHIRLIHPFPSAEILPYIEKAKRVVVIEIMQPDSWLISSR